MLKDLIRVLVVDDSSLMCKVLTSILNSDPQIIVSGVAHNGKVAVDMVSKLKPDLITMDIHMPVMDGFEATRQIMANNPTPILIVSTSVLKYGMDKVFEAISYGALDVIDKGMVDISENKQHANQLIEKVKLLSNIRVIRHPMGKLNAPKGPTKTVEVPKSTKSDKIIGIVSSTGGPEALAKILVKFPKGFPYGIVIVQHMTAGFIDGLAEWLNSICKLDVIIGEDSAEIKPGRVYIAPSNCHMRVEEGGIIRLADEPPYDNQRPSGDILLESLANAYKENAIGVILTGMGRDGAIGLNAIRDMDGKTIAQDEKSCVVFGMPRAAIEMDAADAIVPVDEIAKKIACILQTAPCDTRSKIK